MMEVDGTRFPMERQEIGCIGPASTDNVSLLASILEFATLSFSFVL